MGPLIGALLGGGASGILGGAGGGGFLGGIMGKLLSGGGLGSMLSNLFGGGQQAGASGGADQTNQLLSEIKDMLSQLLEQKGGGQTGGADGPNSMPEGGCHGPSGGDHGCGSAPTPDDHGCGGSNDSGCGSSSHDSGDMGDDAGHCSSKPSHDCGDAGDSGWDGQDKSPSLDRERGAARLLEQAKNTDDPDQKRELINMAMEMLGDGMKEVKGPFGIKLKVPDEGNSYDRDIVNQAQKMLDQIDDSNLDCCNKSDALDSVIDMLMGEGGVDGKPAGNDGNGNGMFDIGDIGSRPLPLHQALFHQH